MSNSDIMVNLSYSADAAQSKTPAGNKKRKHRFFRKKLQYLERKVYLEGKHKHNCREGRSRYDRAAPRQNGEHLSRPTSTVNIQIHSSSTAGSSHCSSLPSTSSHCLPSSGSKGSTPSAAGGRKPAATKTPPGIPTKCLAIDCEMVGTGPKGRVSQLARCSIVSHDGDVVYDKFINPPDPVTDYRSRWSGIRPRDLVNATPYSEARKEILKLLIGKVVIGHAVHNDFKVLGYSHPAAWTRDTSRSPLLNVKAGLALTECASLKRLTKAIFNRDIQTGKRGHSSVEDAKATMELYKVVEEEWEGQLASKSQAS